LGAGENGITFSTLLFSTTDHHQNSVLPRGILKNPPQKLNVVEKSDQIVHNTITILIKITGNNTSA
jgi:hypothetical protein